VGQARSLDEIKQDLLREFQKPKSESQCITKIKEIKQKEGETIWDYDQRFKILLDRLTFQIQDVQHREWFIAGVTSPYPSSTHPTEGDDSSRGSRNFHAPGSYTRRGETSTGLAQVQSQLANLMMQLQDMAKMKVMHEHVWCTTCHSEGNQRDEFPILPNYVAMGTPSPFPSGQT
jgi:hypothetical protein